MRVAKRGDGLRIYETAVDGTRVTLIDGMEATVENCSVRVSDDEGRTWSETACPVAPGLNRVLAVDPSDPDRVLLGTIRHDQGDILWVSTDGGATFERYFDTTVFGGIVVMPDGRVLIGDMGLGTEPTAQKGLFEAAMERYDEKHLTAVLTPIEAPDAGADAIRAVFADYASASTGWARGRALPSSPRQ